MSRLNAHRFYMGLGLVDSVNKEHSVSSSFSEENLLPMLVGMPALALEPFVLLEGLDSTLFPPSEVRFSISFSLSVSLKHLFFFKAAVARDYSSHVESAIAYCDDVRELHYGAGRDSMCAETGSQKPVSPQDVREYYISHDAALSVNSPSDTEVPRFSLQSSVSLPTSSSVPPSAKT